MKMSRLIALVALCFVTSAAAAEWMILGVSVQTYTQKDAILNLSCRDPSCAAWRALKASRPVALVGKGGRNPGSAVCSDTLKGKVVMGSRGQATQAFCRFDDGSLLSLGALQ